MRMKNPMQMKAKIKNFAKDRDVPADIVLHMYVMERFLERLSKSDYRRCFVLKGGYLLYSKWGITERTTSDIDLTAKSVSVDSDRIVRMFGDICRTDVDDGFEISVLRTEPVAEMLDNPGVRVFMEARYGVIERFYVDVVPSMTIVPEELE